MFLKALINTIRWIVLDRQKLIAEGFGDRDAFELELLVPIHQAKGLGKDLDFRSRRVIFVRDPNVFAAIFRAPEDQIDTSSPYAFIKALFGEHSVLVERGESHLRAKQSIYEVIQRSMTIEVDDLMFFDYSIREIFKAGTYPVMPLIQYLTGSFVIRTIFGEQGSARADTIMRKTVALTSDTTHLFLLLSGFVRWTRRFGISFAISRQRKDLRSFVVRQLGKLAVLDDWKISHPNRRPPTRSEIIDNLMTLLILGFETTAATIVWLLYEIASHPDIQIALRNEIHERMPGDAVRYLSEDGTLLAHCVLEALRLHPALPFVMRQVRKEFAVDGIVAHPRDYFVLSIVEMHKRYFGQNADVFRPERYRTEAQHPKFATFGGGTKTCPGRVIAVQEARTICALLISNFAITPTAKTDLRIRHNALSATPRGGMVLSLERLL